MQYIKAIQSCFSSGVTETFIHFSLKQVIEQRTISYSKKDSIKQLTQPAILQ